MSIEIKVPVLPESVADALVSTWYKKPGEAVKRDEHLVDIETDKVVLEVVAPQDGSLETILKPTGSTVKAQEVIAMFKEGDLAKESTTAALLPSETQAASPSKPPVATPAARQLMSEKNIDLKQVSPGPDGRIKKEDVMKTATADTRKMTDATDTAKPKPPALKSPEIPKVSASPANRLDRSVPMTPLRARIAERLLAAQQTAAILTTFNEINMQQVMAIRLKYKESFEKSYGVRLGFMSFFTVAVIEALKHFPSVNASIDGQNIVYHDYYDIGIAVSTSRGLVVPILRDAETLTMADIEKQIADLAHRAQMGKLTMEEITGGTFTITNGGVFGSLMATPILNPPQSGILGMHKILERPIAENGEVVIRPMMYVAFSYDHRIIDGSESVRFLVMVKELLEDPARLALGI